MTDRLTRQGDHVIQVALEAVALGSVEGLHRVPVGSAISVAMDADCAVAAVVSVVLRVSEERLLSADVFLSRSNNSAAWACAMGTVSLSAWDPHGFLPRPDLQWQQTMSPVLNLSVGGHSDASVDIPRGRRAGYRWASGVAARRVTAIELTTDTGSRRAPLGHSGEFVVLAPGAFGSDVAVTAFTDEGLAYPVDL